jgi:hypothetical protein
MEKSKKPQCPDCLFCQYCSETRCRACRGHGKGPRKLSMQEQIAIHELLNKAASAPDQPIFYVPKKRKDTP